MWKQSEQDRHPVSGTDCMAEKKSWDKYHAPGKKKDFLYTVVLDFGF